MEANLSSSTKPELGKLLQSIQQLERQKLQLTLDLQVCCLANLVPAVSNTLGARESVTYFWPAKPCIIEA